MKERWKAALGAVASVCLAGGVAAQPVRTPPEPRGRDGSVSVVLSLRDALERVRERVQAEAANARSDALLDAARFGWSTRPSVRLEGLGEARRTPDYVTTEPLSYMGLSGIVSLDLPLVDGGQRRARRDSALAAARYHETAALDSAEAERQVVDAYAALFVARRAGGWLGEAAARLEVPVARLAAFVEAGEANRLTAAEAEEVTVGIRIEQAVAEGDALEAEGRLRRLLGLWDAGRLEVDLEAELAAAPQPSGAVASPGVSGPAARELLAAERLTKAADEAGARGRFRLDLSAFAGVIVARSEFMGVTYSGTSLGTFGGRLLATVPVLERSASLERDRLRIQADVAAGRARELERAERDARQRDQRVLEDLERRIVLAEHRLALTCEREESLGRLVEAGVRREADLARAAADTERRKADLLRARVGWWARGWRQGAQP